MSIRTIVDYAGYLAVRVLICILQALPLETCERLSAVLATLFCRVRFRVSDENLQHAYPHWSAAERRQVIWRMWRHLFLMVAEVAHAGRKVHWSNWHRHIHFTREPKFIRALLDRRAKVLVSGHFGNFEVGGYLLGIFGFPGAAVARPLDNPLLDRYVAQFRSGSGQSILPKSGSSAAAAELLASGGMLTLLGDQAAGSRVCWITFFGRPASAHKAIALFSLANQVPLIVTYSRRLQRPLYFESGLQALADPCDAGYKLGTVPELTQWYSDQLEEIVRQAPEQYWWLHRRWKGEPSRRRRAATRRDQAA